MPRAPKSGVTLATRATGGLLPPALVFAAARLLLAEAGRAVGVDAWKALSWERFDSVHYLAIATTGYEYFSCERLGGRPWEACGNAAWFPLYPWLLRPLIALGIAPETAGVWLAGLAALGTLVVLWNSFLRSRGLRGWLVLTLAAVFPGAVYQHAIFPTSLALLGLVLAAVGVARARWALAGIAGAGVALSYVTGVLVALPSGVAALLRTRALRPALLAGGIAACGFLGVLALHQLVLGHWDAFYWVHRKGFPARARPLGAFLAVIDPAFHAVNHRHRIIAAQAITVATLVGLGLGMAWARRRRPEVTRAWAVMAALTFWLFPLVVGRGVSLYRSDALVLPVVLLLIELPWPLLAALVIWLVILAEQMARLFFLGYLL
ncbi:MAG TPA: hypothetical protein VFN91_17680 [Myxococcaceae bacterium]|nr:hypothetical protein [Myxococcaceae bacterium]